MQLKFFGAAGTVTGSRYLLDTGEKKILVDCGLFQGYKPLRLRNWAPFAVPPGEIDAVVLPRFLDVPEAMPGGRQFSEEVAREIDRAVKAILDDAFAKASEALSRRRDALDRGAELLLQKETLNEDDLKDVIGDVGRLVPKPLEQDHQDKSEIAATESDR